MDLESTGIGAALGVVTTAITGAVVKVFGTKTERSDDRAAATAEWRELASKARADLDRCSEHARNMDAKIEDLRVSLSVIETNYVGLQVEHAQCPPRIAMLEARLQHLERDSEPPEAA